MTELDMNLNDALIKSKKAIKLSKDSPITNQANIIDTKAEVEWKLGKVDDAILSINEAISLQPENDYFKEQKQKFIDGK